MRTVHIVSHQVKSFGYVGCHMDFTLTSVVFSWFECDRTLTYAAYLNSQLVEERVLATQDVVPYCGQLYRTALDIV